MPSQLAISGAGRGPSLTPALPTTNLQLWLEPNSAANRYKENAFTNLATADGDTLVLKDLSGNARHTSTAADGTDRPILRSITSGGKTFWAAEFTTDDYWILPNFLTGYTAAELFIVTIANADPAADGQDTGIYHLGDSAGQSTHYPWTDGNIYDQFGSTTRQSWNPTPSLASWHCYNVFAKSAEWTARINGASSFTTGTNTVAWNTTPWIGRNKDSYYFKGKIAFAALYNADTAAYRADIHTYISYYFPITF